VPQVTAIMGAAMTTEAAATIRQTGAEARE